ncbi:putative reverse transcriptase domain-containing protein [Tanacetum coccineum]
MAETMEQYMSKTRANYGSGVARPKIEDKDNFELKGQFLKELRTNTFSGSDHEDANEHIEKVLEIVDLFHIPNITIDQVMLRALSMSLTGAASRWLRNKPSGSITTWEDLKTKTKSTETSDGLAAIQAQLNNLIREIKKENENVCAAQVGCEQCKGLHYTKGCPLKHEENSNLIKEIQASTDAAIRNQGASIITLKIQIGQMSKDLQERGFGSLPSSTETNSRDHLKSILTIIEADSYPIRRASFSVLPLSTCHNLGLGELAHTKLTVELADRIVKYPEGIAENVLVGIGKFVFLVDFIILDMPEDIKVPLILERPFLSTARAKIDVFKRKITLRVGKEKIIFKSVKPASSLIKRVYMLSLRERIELDLEARLMGETLVLSKGVIFGWEPRGDAEDGFCEELEEEFEEDPEEDPKEDPEADLEVGAEEDAPPAATPPVESPITPLSLSESSSDIEAAAPIVVDEALEMPPMGGVRCEKKRQAEIEANGSKIRKLEDKDQEKTEEMKKMKKRLGTLEINYALVLSDQNEWKKAFYNLQAWVSERIRRGAMDARPDDGVDGIMPLRRLKKKSVKRLVEKRVAKAIEEYEKTRSNPGNASGSGLTNTGETVNVQGCTHKTFMNGKPHPFNGTEGVVGLRRWIGKVEQVFEICKCAEEDKVMFVASTFEGRALTWSNGNVYTLGLVNVNRIP